MFRNRGVKCFLAVWVICYSFGAYSQSISATAIVPQLVSFSGNATDAQGKPIAGIAGITFAIYNSQYDGVPLWNEAQNVTTDAKGNYTVQLGAATANGLPLELFSSGEARWLGVRINGGEEQPRVLLLSVPYALKAADAQTLGGLPASAFALAAAPASAPATSGGESTAGKISSVLALVQGSPATSSNVTTTGGAVGSIPMFTTSTNIQNSLLTQTGTTAVNVGGKLNLPALGTATASKGFNSQPNNFVASAYNSSSGAAVAQTFQLQAEAVNNDKSTASGTLNLLYGSGMATPAETGLKISNKGVITFATGQTFPGTGAGTITGVTAGKDLTGGGTSGSVTLNLDTTKVPLLAAANTFTGNQTVNGNLSATGTVSGGSFELGSNLFAYGSYAIGNAFLGFAGNTTTTGTYNTASGYGALAVNTTGSSNTADGLEALYSNTTGYNNTGSGFETLLLNTTGLNNTGSGAQALTSNTTGSYNSAGGVGALFGNTTGNYNTASGYESLFYNSTGSNNTASGAQALTSNTTGSYNSASGVGALDFNSTGSNNTASGALALEFNTTGADNTASGVEALFNNTTGPYNTATGYQTLYSNSTANYNTASGTQAMYSTTTGEANLADGALALYSNTTGAGNTAVGANALYSNTTSNYVSCVGYACSSSDNISNATAIGARARVDQSNSLVLGGTGDNAVNVGIGTTKPSNILTVARGAGHPVSDSWETYSSRRWKTNIKTLPDALSRVVQLRGVSYELKDSGKHEIGVIAEEVGQVVPEVVSYEKGGKDATGVDYSRLTALLIEAVKQQQKQIAAQQKLIGRQQHQIAGLSRKVGALETSQHSDHKLVGAVVASR
jgi:hypothetical protein